MKFMILALAAAASLAAPAVSAPRTPAAASSTEEVRIPFVRFGGIRSFHAEENDVVYLQDRSRNWYRAQLYGPCFGLPWAFRLGVDTRGTSSFDRFSTLLVDGERCQIQSLTRSAPPPRKARARRN